MRETETPQARYGSTAHARARTALARYPMERASIDLMQGSLDNPTVIGALIDRGSTTNWFGRVGQLYFSKRLASCGLMASTPF